MVLDLRESLLLRVERHRPDVLPAPDSLLDDIDEPVVSVACGTTAAQKRRTMKRGRPGGRPRGEWRLKPPTVKQLRWLDELHTRHRGQPSDQVRTLWRHLTRGKVAILLDQLVALERGEKKSDMDDARSVDT